MSTLAFDPEETTHWEQVRPRHISPEQWKKFESYAAEILEAFGMNLDTPGTRATPGRYLHALFESTAGYEGDPKLLTAFPTECHGRDRQGGAEFLEAANRPMRCCALRSMSSTTTTSGPPRCRPSSRTSMAGSDSATASSIRTSSRRSTASWRWVRARPRDR